MQYVLTSGPLDSLVERPLGAANVQSVRAIRDGLDRHACRIFGGREGRDWRIKQMPQWLIPLYAADNRTGDTITIK